MRLMTFLQNVVTDIGGFWDAGGRGGEGGGEARRKPNVELEKGHFSTKFLKLGTYQVKLSDKGFTSTEYCVFSNIFVVVEASF